MNNMRFIFLGHNSEDIFTNLAVEEAARAQVLETGKSFMRTAEIIKPAVVIAKTEDINDIDVEKCASDGIDFTRRITGGSVIWLDERILTYFVIVPRKSFAQINFDKIHQNFGKKIGLALKDIGARNVFIGEKFSISLGRGPEFVISGNSVSVQGGCVLYHGVLVIERLDIASIKRYIRLRRNGKVDEEALITKLPSLSGALKKRVSMEEVALRIVQRISEGAFSFAASDEIKRLREAAILIEPRYRDQNWILNPENIREQNLGFCLVALSEEWKEDRFYPV